nr:MAG TPA: hypothetical protein [Caudoviricetes sp.]
MPLVGEWAYHRRGKSLSKPSTACGRPPFRRGTQKKPKFFTTAKNVTKKRHIFDTNTYRTGCGSFNPWLDGEFIHPHPRPAP